MLILRNNNVARDFILIIISIVNHPQCPMSILKNTLVMIIFSSFHQASCHKSILFKWSCRPVDLNGLHPSSGDLKMEARRNLLKTDLATGMYLSSILPKVVEKEGKSHLALRCA